MKIFYWLMGTVIAGTFLPSVFYLLLYATTGRQECARRASAFWNVSRVMALFAFNLLIWGHVAAGLWGLWFR